MAFLNKTKTALQPRMVRVESALCVVAGLPVFLLARTALHAFQQLWAFSFADKLFVHFKGAG